MTISRHASGASKMNAYVGTTATTLYVKRVGDGPLWTTDDAHFPFDITVDGERMTVSDISGTISPQTFTVTRSVNGVVKQHVSNAIVELADPVYFGV